MSPRSLLPGLLLCSGCGPYLQGYYHLARFEITVGGDTFEQPDMGFMEFASDSDEGKVALRYDVGIDADGAPTFTPRPRLALGYVGLEKYTDTQTWDIGPFHADWKAVAHHSTFVRWETDDAYESSLAGAETWDVAFELER